MTLRMGDGPPQNLPAGLDAYAGYVDDGGDGITWPEVEKLTAKYHLSISVHGAPAMCGDVEKGALSGWPGYTVGYCAISNAQTLIDQYGRPKKLWTAHYTGIPHICSSVCGFGFTGQADGTQWTDHNNVWDESLLADDFFDYLTPPPPPQPAETGANMILRDPQTGGVWVVGSPNGAIYAYDGAPFLGGTNNASINPGNYKCVGICEFVDSSGTGYELVLDWGSPAGNGKSADGGDQYRRYKFPRSGTGK